MSNIDQKELALRYIINHIFLPPGLPQQDDYTLENDRVLCEELLSSARHYRSKLLSADNVIRWDPMLTMLHNLHEFHNEDGLSKDRVKVAMTKMQPGDVLALLVRAQNAGVILRKDKDETIFEAFEVSPSNADVMAAKGRLLCSYPGPAVAVPTDIFEDVYFREEFASFLAQMNVDILDSAATTNKAGSTVVEGRDSADPKYITDLLTQILLGMGAERKVKRIQKRIADDILWEDAFMPWRRSPLWLVIRVALQTSLFNTTGDHTEYKFFMVYMMGKILRQGVDAQLPSDLLFCMRAKMSRRLYKLRNGVPGFVAQYVHESGEYAESLLQKRWLEVQELHERQPEWAPETLDPLQDTLLSLKKSSPYIVAALEHRERRRSPPTFSARHAPRLRGLDAFEAANTDALSQGFEANTYIALADFELAIQDHLDDWVKQNLHNSSASTTMAACVAQYSKAALDVYKSNPQGKSLMFLALFELWVALDKVAVAQCPLLKDYSPEVPPGLLESLLLCRSQSLTRAAVVEEYVGSRYENAIPKASVFTDERNASTFPIRYFASSPELQALKRRIEEDAEKQRAAKIVELDQKNDSKKKLVDQASKLKCSTWVTWRGAERHSNDCKKCSLERQASNMRIELHEWPLPEDTYAARTVVFEIDPPVVFRIWRDTTYMILFDICTKTKPNSAGLPTELQKYHSLGRYKPAASRVTLASTSKSFLDTHYKDATIPSTVTRVLVKNGLNFGLYDSHTGVWAALPFAKCCISSKCTLKLNKNSYTHLQYAVTGTDHTTNNVIARQSDCPKDLTLHEYFAFAALRSGPRLQWLNIARELATRVLTFHQEDVYALVAQAAWQIGPLVSGEREWHVELRDANFGRRLLQELEDLLSSIEPNWQESVSAKTIIMLTRRLLASAPDSDVESRAYKLLLTARQITFKWVNQLMEKLRQSTAEVAVQEFQWRVCEMAAICRGTFDLDPDSDDSAATATRRHATSLLDSPNDVCILVTCSICVYDNSPSMTDLPLSSKRILEDDRRLSHSLERLLRERIRRCRRGLDLAITSVWAAYRPGSEEWHHLESPNDRWITTTTASEAASNSEPQCVHFNLLDGQLLVDGKPLGRLPQSVTSHRTYTRVLGRMVLDVIPANISGMEYATRNLIHGYEVLFRMEDTNLVVQAKRENQILELIPDQNLIGDLPRPLVDGYTHWLDISIGEIELRPVNDAWTSAPQNWRIQFACHGHSRMHGRSTLLLVDIQKPTFNMLSNPLLRLEEKAFILVTVDRISNALTVELPRIKLSFFLNGKKRLESNNWPGMIIDTCQSTGTMFGLYNQLVLCMERSELPEPRRVIIPQGEPRFVRDGHHVNIIIDTNIQPSVKYHEYTIDIELCRLTCNNLASDLFKIYLHAVSSHCLPDPLTGRTGTLEALHELGSARCKSFQKLTAMDMEILRKIRFLTPELAFYPAHLEVMQKVVCQPVLPPLVQHHEFSMIGDAIVQHAKRLQLFAGASQSDSLAVQFDSTSPSASHLLSRYAQRNGMFYPENSVGSLESVKADDVVYTSRDVQSRGPDIRSISSTVHRWPTRLNTCPQLLEQFHQWGFKYGSSDRPPVGLSYSRDWLNLNLSAEWLSLYGLCRKSSRDRDRFSLGFSLSAMAYTGSERSSLVPTILAFATVPQFQTLSPPPPMYYDLTSGFAPQEKRLFQIVHASAIEFQQSSYAHLPAVNGENQAALQYRRYSSFSERCDSLAANVVGQLICQWPCQEALWPGTGQDEFFDVPGLMKNTVPWFKTWYWNLQFRDHMQEVQKVLDEVYVPDTTPIPPRLGFVPCTRRDSSPSSTIGTLNLLLERDPPELTWTIPVLPAMAPKAKHSSCVNSTRNDLIHLKNLLLEFQESKDPLHQMYGTDLTSSRESLDSTYASPITLRDIPSLTVLTEHRDQCVTAFKRILESIRQSLLPSSIPELSMRMAGQWPCITPRFLLEKLASTANVQLTEAWRDALVKLAQGLLQLQRSKRLLNFALTHKDEELYKELESSGNDIDDAVVHPDWLLIQIENNFHVRPIQLAVAHQMIAPRLNHNTALQLNMGEGKSSVIVPMVSVALADGKTLVRVVVLKPLSNQMFRLLVDRLSGILNRRVFYLPFSRSVDLDVEKLQQIQTLNQECMQQKGILIVQPEHILSFKLMGIDQTLCSTSTDRNVARTLVESQRWLEEHSRDILDESDEILHVRYQLVYTAGQQRPLEGHPDRWTTVQQVLSLVKRHANYVQDLFPRGIEIQHRKQGEFPFVRVLDKFAGAKLVSLVAQDVSNDHLPNYSLLPLGSHVRENIFLFITQISVSDEVTHLIRTSCEGTSLWSGLLLLRGLLAHGILEYALSAKQYRVDYGLDTSRSLLAVPYRAKDVPAFRAEFGHPDVAIVLTCLSYYYEGLSKDQLLQCFELLDKLDNPTQEYGDWVLQDDAVPDTFRQLSSVNLKDPQQYNVLFLLLHRRYVIVTFFLSHVVFPREAKEFPAKLVTSGWDITETKAKLTTGFSGTNDNRYLLPMSIIQDDPVDQLSTNAKVLSYLLQIENNHYLCVDQIHSAKNFLEHLVRQTPEIRVLLDVGAQMLDMQNQELAEYWLSLVSGAQAVLFFGDNDEPIVLTRDGATESFVSSPFKQQMEKCLVYLDDAHTRGTDLKLPRNYRAAVTLGPKVTKDRLLQGCMRMRKFGHGQAVMFFASPEVDRRIREAAHKLPSDAVEVLDVLRWAMLVTCADIRHYVPHWVQQGVDHRKRSEAWRQFCAASDPSLEVLRSAWMQVEARSLKAMYGFSNTTHASTHTALDIPSLHHRLQLGVDHTPDPRMDEEQEREVSHEVERERQVQRPPCAKSARHHIHPDVVKFVETGIIPQQSAAFSSPFDSITETTMESFRDVWSLDLLATQDFLTTVHDTVSVPNEYLRPVNWIVSSTRGILVILSPYEINELLPAIRRSKKVHLHLYSARVTQRMKSFDDLTFHCVPSLPVDSSWVPPIDLRNQLNLWAGQLYLQDFETYLRLCNFLGVYTNESPSNVSIQTDGFIDASRRSCTAAPRSPFTKSPLPFLQELFGLRRKGMGYLSTHLGKIFHAKLLSESEDFLSLRSQPPETHYDSSSRAL